MTIRNVVFSKQEGEVTEPDVKSLFVRPNSQKTDQPKKQSRTVKTRGDPQATKRLKARAEKTASKTLIDSNRTEKKFKNNENWSGLTNEQREKALKRRKEKEMARI